MREENKESMMTWMQSERNFGEEVVSCARCLMGLWFGSGWRTNGERNCKTMFRKILILLKQFPPPKLFLIIKSVGQFQSMNMVYSQYYGTYVVGSLDCVVFCKAY